MNYIIGQDSITVFFKGNSHTVNKKAQTYAMVLEAIRLQDGDKLSDALNLRNTINNMLSGVSDKIRIEGKKIFYGEREVTGLISSRIFEVIAAELDIKPMVRFLENLMSNPSKRSVDELFGFLDACNLPITEDGHFLAYKRVRNDYKDCHSATMDNSVGKIVEMQRNQVDDNKDQTCSYGLHACSYSYLSHFGGDRIVVVKINPADVVSVPVDYNNAKLRTCRYEVVDEIPLNEYNMPVKELPSGFTNEYEDDSEDEEETNLESTSESRVNGSAKLTADDVINIRTYFDSQRVFYTYSALINNVANLWKISRRQVARIIKREAWKNV